MASEIYFKKFGVMFMLIKRDEYFIVVKLRTCKRQIEVIYFIFSLDSMQNETEFARSRHSKRRIMKEIMIKPEMVFKVGCKFYIQGYYSWEEVDYVYNRHNQGMWIRK